MMTPRWACSLAYTCACAASLSRRTRPNRSSCQLAPSEALYSAKVRSAAGGSGGWPTRLALVRLASAP
jgi:hypothetical protein